MAARKVDVVPKGLVLDTNELAASPGAFRELHNFAIREPGYISLLPGAVTLDSTAGNDAVGERVFAVQDAAVGADIAAREILLRYDVNTDDYSATAYTNNAGSVADMTLPSGYTGLVGATDPRVGFFTARGRGFMTDPVGGLLVMSETDTAATPRAGTIPQPQLIAYETYSSTDGLAVSANKAVGYRATFYRKESDGYEIESAPSYAIVLTNGTASVINFTVLVGWQDQWPVRAGDFVRLWRTKEVDEAAEPNDTYYLAQEIVLAAGDITAHELSILDTCPPDGLRQELYTNPGQQGAGEANAQIGPLADAAWFAEHAFYVAPRLREYVTPRVRARFGHLQGSDGQRQYGIGRRQFTGTATATSAVITGVAAADFDGLYVGQFIARTNGTPTFVDGTYITALNSGAGTVTVSTAAVGAAAAVTWWSWDNIALGWDASSAQISCANFFDMMTDVYDAEAPVLVVPNFRPKYTDILDDDHGSADGAAFFVQLVGNSADLVIDSDTNPANWNAVGYEGEIDERAARLLWSKLDQPEHVPASHELSVGAGSITRLLPLPEALLCFCTDGLYRITGFGGSWSVDLVDATVRIPNQAAADSMNGTAYAYGKDVGLMRIGINGVEANLSRGAIEQAFRDAISADLDDDTYNVHVACDPLHVEVAMFARNPPGASSATLGAVSLYVFNERQECWRTQDGGTLDAVEFSAFAYSPYRRSLVWILPDWAAGEGTAELRKYSPDDDLRDRLDGTFETHEIVPDGDPVAMKRFLEVTFAVVNANTSAPVYSMATSSANSPSVTGQPADGATRLYTLRFLPGRNDRSVSGSITVLGEVESTFDAIGEYDKIAAISVQWQPESELGIAR